MNSEKSEAIRTFLTSHEITIVRRIQPKPFVPNWYGWQVRANNCDTILLPNPGLDATQDMLERFAGPHQNIYFIYRGNISREYPASRTALDQSIGRALWPIGLTRWRQPLVVVVISKSGCTNFMTWPWKALGT